MALSLVLPLALALAATVSAAPGMGETRGAASRANGATVTSRGNSLGVPPGVPRPALQAAGYRPPLPPFEPPRADALSAQRAQLEALQTRAAAGQVTNKQNLALFRFKLEQAQLWLGQISASPYYDDREAIAQFKATLARAGDIAVARGDAALWTGSFHERAYLAAADGSAQPYWVYLPKNYSPKRKYPLVMFLHGYDPALTKAVPWLPSLSTAELATERGFILAIPYGRRNTDFLMLGEDDTLAVTAQVQRFYSIDSERIFLMGVSMGGYGVYAVGLHHPDLWAGLTPMAARSDTYLWLKLQGEAVAPWKRPLYEADDPRTLAPNAQNVPIYVQHGGDDNVVPVEHARLMVGDLKKLGYAVRYREIAGGSHYIYLQADSYRIDFDWMTRLRRVTGPRRVVYITASLRNNSSYWVRIDSFADYSKRARIDASISGDTLSVKLHNVGGFTLTPPRALLTTPTLKLVVDGVAAGTVPDAAPIVWSAPAPAADPGEPAETAAAGAAATDAAAAKMDDDGAAYPGVKSRVRSGPIRDCYRDPILLVYGTQEEGAGETGQSDRDQALQFQGEWQRYVDGVPPLKADSEVTPADRHDYNLVLFGTRRSNAIIAAIADRLPVELTPTGYRLGNLEYAGHDLGMVLAYPSPFDARRMVIVNSGQHWGLALAVNHKFDLLPDYIVFDRRYDLTDATNHALAAGFFDGHWQLPPQAQLQAQPESP